MLESGAEKGLLQCPAERQGGSYPKSPELPKGFWQSIFKSQVREQVSQGTLLDCATLSDQLMVHHRGYHCQSLALADLGLCAHGP